MEYGTDFDSQFLDELIQPKVFDRWCVRMTGMTIRGSLNLRQDLKAGDSIAILDALAKNDYDENDLVEGDFQKLDTSKLEVSTRLQNIVTCMQAPQSAAGSPFRKNILSRPPMVRQPYIPESFIQHITYLYAHNRSELQDSEAYLCSSRTAKGSVA